jgi:hypothetical protein
MAAKVREMPPLTSIEVMAVVMAGLSYLKKIAANTTGLMSSVSATALW